MNRSIIAALLALSALSASGQEITCVTVEKAVKNIYDRVAKSKNNNLLMAVEEGRLAFWDVYDVAPHCTGLKRYAGAMDSNKLGRNDRPVVNAGPVIFFGSGPASGLPAAALGGSSNSRGVEVPKYWQATPLETPALKGGGISRSAGSPG